MSKIDIGINPIVIQLPLFEMWNQKVIKTYCSCIELYPDYYQLKYEFKSSEMIDKEDPARGWEESMKCYDTKIMRNCCAGVDLDYSAKTDEGKNPISFWVIQILNFHGTYISKVYIENQEKAKEAYEILWNWIYEKV